MHKIAHLLPSHKPYIITETCEKLFAYTIFVLWWLYFPCQAALCVYYVKVFSLVIHSNCKDRAKISKYIIDKASEWALPQPMQRSSLYLYTFTPPVPRVVHFWSDYKRSMASLNKASVTYKLLLIGCQIQYLFWEAHLHFVIFCINDLPDYLLPVSCCPSD